MRKPLWNGTLKGRGGCSGGALVDICLCFLAAQTEWRYSSRRSRRRRTAIHSTRQCSTRSSRLLRSQLPCLARSADKLPRNPPHDETSIRAEGVDRERGATCDLVGAPERKHRAAQHVACAADACAAYQGGFASADSPVPFVLLYLPLKSLKDGSDPLYSARGRGHGCLDPA